MRQVLPKDAGTAKNDILLLFSVFARFFGRFFQSVRRSRKRVVALSRCAGGENNAELPSWLAGQHWTGCLVGEVSAVAGGCYAGVRCLG